MYNSDTLIVTCTRLTSSLLTGRESWFPLSSCGAVFSLARANPGIHNDQTMETIILIHGLWMHGVALLPQQRRLARRGFTVRRFSYPSMGQGLQQNAGALSRFVAATGGDNIHLVGHSLGGLVALSMLAQYPAPRVRRVVLMGSPFMGSHCASVLLRTPTLAAIV